MGYRRTRNLESKYPKTNLPTGGRIIVNILNELPLVWNVMQEDIKTILGMNLPISLFHDEQSSTFMNKLCCNEVNCLRFHQTHLLCILDTTKSRSISPHIRCRRRPAQPFKSAFKVFPCITVEIEESQPTNTLRNQTTKRRLQLTRARDMKEKCHAPIRFIDIS